VSTCVLIVDDEPAVRSVAADTFCPTPVSIRYPLGMPIKPFTFSRRIAMWWTFS